MCWCLSVSTRFSFGIVVVFFITFVSPRGGGERCGVLDSASVLFSFRVVHVISSRLPSMYLLHM